MKRYFFKNKDVNLSYLDSKCNGPVIIALHAHWGEGVTFESLAKALAPKYRVIALDQRGHGFSDHAKTYSRSDYMSDIDALFNHLEITEPVVLLGNSLGGLNSYQFAARNPHRVRAMIIEDVQAEILGDMSFCLAWEGIFKTRADLEQCVGARFAPYLKDSFRETNDGWRLAFTPSETMVSISHVLGDYWNDWLATTCPTLLIRGAGSVVTNQEHMEEMHARRPNTTLVTLQGGHLVHVDNPQDFQKEVSLFLEAIPTYNEA